MNASPCPSRRRTRRTRRAPTNAVAAEHDLQQSQRKREQADADRLAVAQAGEQELRDAGGAECGEDDRARHGEAPNPQLAADERRCERCEQPENRETREAPDRGDCEDRPHLMGDAKPLRLPPRPRWRGDGLGHHQDGHDRRNQQAQVDAQTDGKRPVLGQHSGEHRTEPEAEHARGGANA
jgi:hypothetical protein